MHPVFLGLSFIFERAERFLFCWKHFYLKQSALYIKFKVIFNMINAIYYVQSMFPIISFSDTIRHYDITKLVLLPAKIWVLYLPQPNENFFIVHILATIINGITIRPFSLLLEKNDLKSLCLTC